MADINPYLSLVEQDKPAPVPAPAANDNPYTSLAQQDLELSKQRLKGVLDIVSPVNPDQAAESLKLSRSSGLPAQTVQDNLIEVRRQERLRLLNTQRILTESPVLARQLMDPDFAKIAHDDIPPMSNLEMSASYITRSLGSGLLTLTGAATKVTESVLSLAGIVTPEEDIAVLFKNNPGEMKRMIDESPATALSRWAKSQQKLANDIMANAPDAVKSKYGNLEYFTTDSDKAAYYSPTKVIGDAFQSLPTTLALMFSMYITRGQAASTYSSLIEAGVAREVAAKEAARAAASTMAKVSAITEGIAGYATQANQTRLEVDKITQAQLEQSPAYQQLIAEGFEPETARTYLSAITAERAGTIAGVVDAITNFYGGKVLGKVIGEGGALVPRAAKGFGTEALTEAPQSVGEQFGQNLATQQLMNPNQDLTEGLGEAGAAGFVVGGVTGGVFSAAIGRTQEAQNQAGKANVMFDLLTQLNDLSAASKVRERDVQSFESFMQSVSDEAPVNTLYIEPKTLLDTLVAAGANIAELKATLPSLANLDEQLRTGTEVAIPVSEFTARMSGQDYAQALLPHLKTDPSGMSKAQADEYMASHGDKLKAEVEKVLAEKQGDETFKASMDKVKADVAAQLEQTQRFTKDVTEAYAALMSTFYAVTGAKVGMTPEQMAAKYPIKITAESVTGEQQYDQAGKLKTETPAFKAWSKGLPVHESFKEAGSDRGVFKLYHATTGNFSEFKPGGLNPKDSGPAIWLAGNPRSTAAAFRVGNEQSGFREGANIMPVYARLENPLVIDDKTMLDFAREVYGKSREFPQLISQEAADALKADGYDSILFKGEQLGWGENTDEIVVFDPAQIKSAIGNNGNYDPNNPNILNQDNEQTQLDAAEDAKSDDVAEITQGNVPESVDAASVLENALKIAKSQVWAKGRDLKLAIQEAVQKAAQAAGVDVGAPSPQTTEYLVRAGVKDALLALQQNANAIGWYDIKTRQALSVMALVHPEIAKDQNARFAFVWALAVTSNGMKVGKNFELAEAAYEAYKRDGRMPTNIQAGQAQKAINESLQLFNELVEAWGIDDLRRFMLTNFTVGEIAAISKQLKPGGEHAATFVKGAAILGPKIGNGFFSNLYGNFDQLTMDRWLVRTWGRWTGTLIKPMPQQTQAARERLTAARDAVAGDARLEGIIGTPITKETKVDELALKIQEASTDPLLRAQMNESEAGLELRKAGNSLAKYLDGQKEAPAGPNERNYIRQVFSEMLAELQQRPEYQDLTMADLQAVLWYAEKRLYETAKEENDEEDATGGYNDEDAPDYANAAADVARAKGVSDRKIQNALKKEEQNGRTGNARSADGQQAQAGGQQDQAAGFTKGQKRLFIGTQAVHRVRSNRAGGQGQSFAYSGQSNGDGGETRLLKKKALGITYVAEWKPGRSLGTIFRANGITTPTFYELGQGDEKNAQRFADAITESKKASGAVGAAVYVYPVQDYQGMRLFLAADGKSGVAIKPDGDIVSVFSNGGAGRSVMELAIAAGGTKLDAFDTILPQFYSAHGFVATSRLTWNDSQAPEGWDKQAMADFNGGQPDVVFMVLDNSYQGMYTRKDGKRYEGDDSYDKAVAAQTRAQRKMARGGGTFNQDQPTFYSALARAVEGAKQAKAPASDWLAIISKLPGVKAEEIDWTGLKDYLELRGKDQVTKQEISDYLDANGVQVEEVMRESARGTFTDIESAMRYLMGQDMTEEDVRNEYGYIDDQDYIDLANEMRGDQDNDGTTTKYDSYTLPGGENYRELLLTLPRSNFEKPDASGQVPFSNAYRSSHWDEENILAHVRFNERTDADGNKVLFIEELQSDWAQEGRKKGFAGGVEEAEAALKKFTDDLVAKYGIDGLAEGKDTTEEKAEFARLSNAVSVAKRGVPTAPFVGDTKGWLNLALKRMIRYAAENGFDKVAFVNGEQSSDRYDLSKQISSIAYDPQEKLLDAWDHNRRKVLRREITDESQLEELVGKEVAKRLLDQPLVKGKHLLDGENIKVGGEGMKSFYDKIVPQVVNDLLKKLGGDKMETISINAPDRRAMGGGAVMMLDENNRSDQPGFTITDKMRETVMQGQPLFQGEQAPRGQISFGSDITQTPSVITLLKAANLSTFLHESGHFFLEVYADIASRTDAPVEITKDMDAVLRWFGVENIQTWRAMDIEQKRPYHEKFARGFEAYLFEGKSPSLEMTGIFQRFRSWMVNIYKQITALNVELDDEIRGVFDRMLASSDAIKEAEQARSYVPLFTTKPAFMSDEEWRAYQESDFEASQNAVSELERRSLRDMQWISNAKSRIIKQLQKDAAEKRKEVRREVENEVMSEPVYRAREFLKRGTIDGEKVEGGYKLSLPEIEVMYGDNPIVGTIKQQLGFGKYGMLGTENGIHPNQVAEIFGFSSGDHLVRSLLEAPDPRGVIEQRTDERMLERYGDLNSPQALSRAADEAIHNDARARFVATEANALAKATGRPEILASAAKQFAEQIISRLKIRDIRPGQYAASAARAAKNAAKPGIDLVEAATEKRNQVINTYAAKSAFNAQDEVAKAIRYLRRFDSKNITKSVHIDYLEQIWNLLDRFDLRTSTTLKDIDKRRALIEWVNAQREKGEEPVIPEKLLNEAYRVSYKDMTLEDFRGLIDAVRNIEHLGRLKDKLLKIQDQREFKAVVADASETIRENATKDIPQQLEKKGLKDAVVSGGREVLAWHRKFASLIRQMDGFKDGGTLWQIFSRPMNDAATKEASMREQATVRLAELYKMLGKVDLNKKTFIPAIGASLSLEGRLAVALNMGNETNMRRVMEGEGWNAGQVNAVVGDLTREQWNFVQSVWDMLNSYWPEISAKERRMTGLVPEKVESRPFTVTLADGTQMSLEGGYYPIKYNADRSSKAEADTAAEVLKQMERGLYARAQTARGHLEARVQSVGRPMRYDLGVIDQHLNQVIHDLSWHEYLVDANRLLRADPIDSAIRDHYGPEVLRTMRGMLEDIAIGELPAQGTIENAVRWVRAGSSIAAMGWSIITAVQQPTGLAQSMVRVGPKWVAQGMSRWLRDAASMQNTVAWIGEKSEFMRLRAKTQQREIAEIRNTIYKGETMSAVQGSFFYLITKMQLVADVPTWLGMYEKAMAEGADEPRAIALADQAVLDSQGGGQVKDLSKIQRGGEWQKLWTNFYSYFNVTYNLLAESVGETRKVGASRLPLLAVDFLMLTVVPATLGFLIKAALKGGDDDEDKMAKKLVAENLSYLMGLMVGTREIGAAVSGSMGYEGPAGARFFADIGKFAKQVEQGDADEAFWRSANELGGVVFHYPASQIDRTVRGVYALSEGKTDNPLAILAGPPPKK